MQNSKKRLGVWMNHSIAHIIEIKNNAIISNYIEANTMRGGKQNLGNYENTKHNTEQDQQAYFYQRLGDIIMDYSEVLLFGPTNAKTELLNLLKKDSHFNNIKIYVEKAENLKINQMHAFVKEYFDNVG